MDLSMKWLADYVDCDMPIKDFVSALTLSGSKVECFEQEGIVSESAPPLGTCSQLEGEQLERVRKFEEKYNAVVYHVIHSFTNIGELESYLFVSDRPDEWETDRKDLKSGQPLAWVYNYDEPDWPELGYIGVSLTTAAGLRRTW